MSTLGQDILTTAVEGGIGYFAVITDSKRTPDLDWVEVTVEPEEDPEDFEPTVVKATQMVRAASVMVQPDYNLSSEMKQRIREMLNERDAGIIDSYDAQAIFQQAAFGEQVFG
jgi:hypothetical protein